MCGFTGFFNKNTRLNTPIKILEEMGNELNHRGPDDSGIWTTLNDRLGFSFKRLAILDLSPKGHQPMLSKNGRYVIVFNGEIYNHLNLREDLSHHHINWNGSSDTETLLECIDRLGIDQTLKKINGMFAFALWDRNDRKLLLVRDRFGEKPLYYGWCDNTFLFGSELKSFKKHPHFKPDINNGSLDLLLKLNYIPAPNTIYKNFNKLIPGSILEVSFETYKTKITKYWSPSQKINKSKTKINNQDLIKNLDYLLSDSIKKQSISDVPIGAFLSGGIDSSLVVSIMKSISNTPIKTFSIGFNEGNYNEARQAKKIANYLSTEHTELYVDSKDALNIVGSLSNIYCEPFADSSQIPTYLVSKLAKKSVTVALTGDGGDELFLGYNRYKFTNIMWNRIKHFPKFIRILISRIILLLPTNIYDKILTRFFNGNNFGHKINKAAKLIVADDFEDLYFKLISHFESTKNLMLNRDFTSFNFRNKSYDEFKNLSTVEKLMIHDLFSYLPDDILVKVDRASMSNSLETRAPFLDKDVFNYAFNLPEEFKLKKKETKWILKELLKKYLPENLINQKKIGFGIQVSEWLRGPLKDWACDTIYSSEMKKQNFLNQKEAKKMLDEHLNSSKNWQYQLWTILIFQNWLNVNA